MDFLQILLFKPKPPKIQEKNEMKGIKSFLLGLMNPVSPYLAGADNLQGLEKQGKHPKLTG
jgi:hypothetical protein